MLLWLWCRLAAVAPIWPLAWESPYAAGTALKRQRQINKMSTWSSHHGSASMRSQVWSLASLGGLRIWHCHELWCRLQTRLRSGIAVVVAKASSCSSDLTPSLGISICCKCGPKKKRNNKDKKKQKKKKKKKKMWQACFYLNEIFFQSLKNSWTSF